MERRSRFRQVLKETVAVMLWMILGVGGLALLTYGGIEGSWGHVALGVLFLFVGLFWVNWYHSK